ncbi:helix-turn-helix transcriptional regulator [Variovorax sp. PvP013]|jgi:PAS domain S-box-containing protein|uniref:helix-turn-helix transcriptional regulator n=1 Tax=Variovorax sp. PvP013 TaxID=3156435 RepID=UPI003D21C990
MTDTVLQRNTDRRQLQQIIAGLTEGVILIEPDQTIVWANEAALRMHGVTTLGDLGRDVTDYRERFRLRYRNNHALEDGRYPIERVISGEKFTDVVVEVFLATDHDASWVHRVRSLVLTDDDGHPDVLVLILHDASEWADAERRFERTFNANPAPAIICRLSDQRYIKVNLGFLDMTGYASEDLIGRTAYEFDVLERADRRDAAIEQLRDGLTIPQMEAELRLPGDARKPVVVAGQPIEIGEEPCMLFTFVDLEPRRRAEASLRLSEDRFRKAFRMLPVPSAVLRADDLEILDVNEAFCVATDCRAEDLVGPRGARVSAWLDPFVQAVVQHLARHASMRNVDLRIDFGNGEPLNCLVSAERVTIDGQACLLLTWLDITERRRSEMELVDAIELVLQDTSWFSRSLVEKLANVRRSGAIASRIGIDDLTAREQQVLEALSQGHSDKEIAKRLDVALGTVRNHVARIYTKIGVHSRNAALLWARDRGHFPTRTRGAGGRDD